VIVALQSDLGALVTTIEAARHCNVKPATIRQWVARGHLVSVGRLPAGGPAVYRLADVTAAELKTRAKANRGLDVAAILAELARVSRKAAA
jgi:DNA-binding transcriptional MerR regulator